MKTKFGANTITLHLYHADIVLIKQTPLNYNTGEASVKTSPTS